MKPTEAFDICHEIYSAARESVDSRLPTMQLGSASKFLWRPNVRPRLVEYVADFALAGEKALTPAHSANGCRTSSSTPCRGNVPGAGAKVEGRAHGSHITAATAERGGKCLCGAPAPLLASRLVLFRVYYLGGAEYHSARRLLGIGELTWSAWSDEIRSRVGAELLRRGMFPPSRYFRQPSRK